MSSEKWNPSEDSFSPNAQGDLIFLGHLDNFPSCGGDTCAFMNFNDTCKQIHCNVPCAPSVFFKQAGPLTVAVTWIPVGERLPINAADEMACKYQEVDVIATYSDGTVHPATFKAGCTVEFWTGWNHNNSVCGAEVVGWMPLPPAMPQPIPLRK